jgi:ribosomal-protein-alanine N-acetyltransferase
MAKPDERFVFQPLKTARLQLILPEPADALRLVRYYEENKQHFAPWQSLRSEEFYTEAFWLAEIARLRDDFRSDRGLTVVLVDNFDPEGKVLGQISLMNIIRGVFHGCFLGYSVHHQAEGKGLMFEAVTAVIAYAFNEMQLHRIMANYIPTNERSARLLQRLGFVIEGYARNYLFLGGKWQDHVLTSLVKPN